MSDNIDTTYHVEIPVIEEAPSTYEQGWNEGLEQLLEALKMLPEALCRILDFLPSKQLTLPIKVNDKCIIEITVAKK